MSNIIEVGYGEALQFGVEQGTYIRIGSRDEIEALHAENKDLKQQVEQGKRDAERYLATLVISNEAIRQFRNEDMLARLIKLRGTQGYCQLVSAFDIGRDVIEAAIAEAPK